MPSLRSVFGTGALVLALAGVGFVSAAANQTLAASYLAPGFLTKATTLATDAMKQTLEKYTHAAQSGRAIPAASECVAQHDELLVSKVEFDSLHVSTVNDSWLEVAIVGLTPLTTTNVGFSVKCVYNGAFDGALQLPQQGTVFYTVSFAPTVVYHIEITPTPDGGVTLQPPVLVSSVSVAPTYAYTEQGFALDIFVASYFEQTVADEMHTEVVSLLSYPSPFATAWLATARDSLKMFEDVCSTGRIPQYDAIALWQKPGCAVLPDDVVTESLLSSRDVLIIEPANNGEERRVPPSGNVAAGAAPLPPTCYAVPCINSNTSGGVSVVFSDCVQCAPDEGTFVEMAMNVSMTIG